MEISPEVPFLIEEVDAERAIVRFNPRCDQARSHQHEKELADLVATHQAVACDLTVTSVMASDWLRWLARLTSQARHAGKTLALVGLGPTVGKTVDVLGLGSALDKAGSFEEVWKQ